MTPPDPPPPGVRRDRLQGLLLFLPVPLVLWLFTRAPLGSLASLGLGGALMATHRLYARPFALARARRRCLWCGAAVAVEGVGFEVAEPFGTTAWRACGPRHAAAVARLLEWADRRGPLLSAGILGTLLLFLGSASLAALGRLGSFQYADAVALFRLGIAASVLPAGWLSRGKESGAAAGAAPLRSPFPLHVQALIGTSAVLWLFRLVGLYWLAAGLCHVAGRVGWL